MGSFSLVHWVVVILILLLVFGPKRLSEVGKGLGQGIRNFKKGMEGSDGEDREREEPRRLSRGDATKQLEPRRTKAASEPDEDEEDADEDAGAEEEEARPRKKSRRA